jgi:hypothetical protein
VPLAKELELTVTVDAPPIHTLVADGEVKLATFGKAPTLKEATLETDILLEQFDEFFSAVIVTVVGPIAVSAVDGMVNVPLPELMANIAVRFVALFAPLKLYATVYDPLESELEFTVTVDEAPKQTLVAEGQTKPLTLGTGLTVDVTVTVVAPQPFMADNV